MEISNLEKKQFHIGLYHFWVLLFLGGFVGLWVQWGAIEITKAQFSKRVIIKDV